ncbi:hypothetical protein HYU06_04325, partial [Candidatus Woesearchaeota archaeon]|nr:hypothetical protein [Candidatus Woesearchaeota archaeon]
RYLKVKDIVGILKTNQEDAAAFSKRVKQIREELGKGMEKRMEDIRSRLVSRKR